MTPTKIGNPKNRPNFAFLFFTILIFTMYTRSFGLGRAVQQDVDFLGSNTLTWNERKDQLGVEMGLW